MYTVYQIRITNEDSNLVNQKGWDDARKESSVANAYYLAKIQRNFQESFDLGHHKKVAEIDANSLEKVFTIGNMGPENCIVRLDTMFSVSVGDVIEDSNGCFYAVAPIGFEELKKTK